MDPTEDSLGYLSHGVDALLKLGQMNNPEHYASAVKSGHRKIEKHLESIFNGKRPEKKHSHHVRKKVDEWLEKGGINEDIANLQAEQHGHEVNKPITTPELETAIPQQNMLLQAARSRVSNYLNAQRPQKNAPKLAFDPEPATEQQKRSYKRARDMAIDPMKIIDHIHDGTLETEDLMHFQEMYPELHDRMQKKLTEGIIQAQLDGTKPPFRIRHGLGMLLGASLASEATPANMQAAQATFRKEQQIASPAVQKGGVKKKTSALTKSNQAYLTNAQAITRREQKS